MSLVVSLVSPQRDVGAGSDDVRRIIWTSLLALPLSSDSSSVSSSSSSFVLSPRAAVRRAPPSASSSSPFPSRMSFDLVCTLRFVHVCIPLSSDSLSIHPIPLPSPPSAANAAAVIESFVVSLLPPPPFLLHFITLPIFNNVSLSLSLSFFLSLTLVSHRNSYSSPVHRYSLHLSPLSRTPPPQHSIHPNHSTSRAFASLRELQL